MHTNGLAVFRAILLLVSALALTPLSAARAQEQDALRALLIERAEQVVALVAESPVLPPELFDAAFLAAVPRAQLLAITAGMHSACGSALRTTLVDHAQPFSANFELELERACLVPMNLTIAAAPPHRVTGLWFGPSAPALPSLEAIAEALAELPGAVSFAAARLPAEGEPEWLATHEPARPLAIGSAFKLWILAALADDVRAGSRRWSDVVTLRPEWKSLPSGELQIWPDGSPLTLHTLATAMISRSDNTATDHLLFSLGRERVERMLAELGLHDAVTPGEEGQPPLSRNVPLLSTAELFRLKLELHGAAAQAWQLLPDAEQRRAFLEQDVAALPLHGAGTDPGAFAQPKHIESIEWFASAADLVRTQAALRRLAFSAVRDDPAATTDALLGTLAVNPGLPAARGAFEWAGFKGGSETGVLCFTWLLRAHPAADAEAGGAWYALALVWNDPAAALDEARLAGLASRALQLLAQR